MRKRNALALESSVLVYPHSLIDVVPTYEGIRITLKLFERLSFAFLATLAAGWYLLLNLTQFTPQSSNLVASGISKNIIYYLLNCPICLVGTKIVIDQKYNGSKICSAPLTIFILISVQKFATQQFFSNNNY